MTNSGAAGDYNAKVIEEFRANGGRVGGRLADTTLVLVHHVGARSGTERVTPLACVPLEGGRYLVLASNGGAPKDPHWAYNLRANPETTAEVGTETFPVLARETEGAEREELWAATVAQWPFVEEFEARAGRRIPLFLLTRKD